MRPNAYLVGSIALLAIFVLYLSIGSVPASSEFSFDIGGCQDQKEATRTPVSTESGDLLVETDGTSVKFSHNLDYVCCAKINLKFEQNSNLLKITEVNEGNMCKCMCTYDISGQIDNLEPGNYNLEIHGIEYQNQEPELMYSQEIEIK